MTGQIDVEITWVEAGDAAGSGSVSAWASAEPPRDENKKASTRLVVIVLRMVSDGASAA